VEPTAVAVKKRVLFVCIGNSCRSQMAEGFAKAYGADVIAARSAGLSPATMIAPLTKQILEEHNVRIDDHFPKGLDIAAREPVDLLVNMSGRSLNLPGAQVIEWRVQDPIGLKDTVYREVASQIEGLVMRLILELRGGARAGR
jgi:arsenate reductase